MIFARLIRQLAAFSVRKVGIPLTIAHINQTIELAAEVINATHTYSTRMVLEEGLPQGAKVCKPRCCCILLELMDGSHRFVVFLTLQGVQDLGYQTSSFRLDSLPSILPVLAFAEATPMVRASILFRAFPGVPIVLWVW
jgi:hypothetical protein